MSLKVNSWQGLLLSPYHFNPAIGSFTSWLKGFSVGLICTFIKSLFLLYENVVRLNYFLAALMSLSSYKG